MSQPLLTAAEGSAHGHARASNTATGHRLRLSLHCCDLGAKCHVTGGTGLKRDSASVQHSHRPVVLDLGVEGVG